jgi:membrane fusion protein (multidrug efflux system)
MTDAPPAVPPSAPPAAQGPGAFLRVAIAATAILGVGGAVWFGFARFERLTPYAWTENAYVQGDVTWIAPRVAGYVVEILVEDNAAVAPAQPLLGIDPRDYRAALREADAATRQARSAIRQNDADRDLLAADVRVADADLDAAKGSLARAEAEFARAEQLRDRGSGTDQALDQRRAELIEARAAVAQSEARLDFQRTRSRVIDAARARAEADLAAAEAAAYAARIRVEDSRVWSPIAGRVSARSVRLGEYVTIGQRLLAVAPVDRVWITANFRETLIGRMRPGDRAAVAVDALPGVTLCATVESLSAASGADFALIPPDNATGNFTKVVRRFPVRLVLDPDQPGAEALRIGMSVAPSVALGSHVDGRGEGGALADLMFWGGGFPCASEGPTQPPRLPAAVLPIDIGGEGPPEPERGADP